MGLQIQDILNDIERLVSLPAAYVRINQLVEDPAVGMEDIARVINQDVALTARLLRIANSPLYGFPSQIDTVTKAVKVLGTQQVRDLALATVAIKTFEGIPNDLVSMESFWKHSIYCALCARILAMECHKRQREALFVTGLLHDIGQLVLYNRLPDLSRQVLEACADGPDELESQDAERDIIGFTHADIGGELAHRWSLPACIREGIAYHHAPEEAVQCKLETAIVHLANSLATLTELQSTDLAQAPRIHPIAWELTGLEPDIIAPVISGARAQFAGARALLTGSLV
jgi:HD-like signal output (HDOD) protein